MKINTSLIENFDTLSAEEKLNAILDLEIPDDKSQELAKQKNLIDKYTSEISSLKKAAKEHLDENERAKLEQTEAFETLKSQYNELLKESKIDKLTRRNIQLGYSDDLAFTRASAIVNGDEDMAFEAEKKHLENLEKRIKASVVKNTANPDDKGSAKKDFSKEELGKMSIQERFAYAKEHPEEYKKLYGGN